MSWTIRVLGGWWLVAPNGEVRPVRRSTQRLLAFLALHDRAQRRAHIAGNMWPDNTEERASANLRSAIWHARNESPGIVDADRLTVSLCSDVSTDFEEASQVIRAVLVGRPVLPGELAMLRSDVLPDWPDDWLRSVRFLHRQLRLLATERAGGDAAVTTVPPSC